MIRSVAPSRAGSSNRESDAVDGGGNGGRSVTLTNETCCIPGAYGDDCGSGQGHEKAALIGYGSGLGGGMLGLVPVVVAVAEKCSRVECVK